MARVASFAPDRAGAREQMMLPWTQIYYVYVQQKTCDYHYYQYIRSTETNLFHEERLFNRNHLAGCKFHLQPALCHLACEKGAF